MNDALLGCLLGTTVGDAIGLPFEGVARRRIPPGVDGHRWFLGRGMISDDTEHTWIVLDALWRAGGDPAVFRRELAWGLRWWFWAVPAAAGWATMRACLKLSLGFGPDVSGVFSAGNGPAMRAAIIGVWFREDEARLRQFVRIATRITHTDPKAEIGALAVAMAAAGRVPELPAEALEGGAREWGVSGYIYDTVPAVLRLVEQFDGDYRGGVLASPESHRPGWRGLWIGPARWPGCAGWLPAIYRGFPILRRWAGTQFSLALRCGMPLGLS